MLCNVLYTVQCTLHTLAVQCTVFHSFSMFYLFFFVFPFFTQFYFRFALFFCFALIAKL